MLKNDRWITEQAAAGMLDPFQEGLVRHLEPDQKQRPVLSFGCSSFGYDLRLSAKEFLIFKHVLTVIIPSDQSSNLEYRTSPRRRRLLHSSCPFLWSWCGVGKDEGAAQYHGDLLGKSTHACLGIIVNTTPAEASWEGISP